MTKPKHTHFPMFMESTGKEVLIIGGGAVAERRVRSLLEFGFRITVIAESLTQGLQSLAEENRFRFVREICRTEGAYAEADAAEFALADRFPADMILACTDDRELNRSIGDYAKRKKIPVNVCDAREESTFWFPAIAVNDELAMGLVGTGEDHAVVRRAAAALRAVIEDKKY